MGEEGHPSAPGGAAVPVEGGGLTFRQRRKMTRVGRSWAECTGPEGQRGQFRWEIGKNGGGPHEDLGFKKSKDSKYF
jgi:hypothetical protein